MATTPRGTSRALRLLVPGLLLLVAVTGARRCAGRVPPASADAGASLSAGPAPFRATGEDSIRVDDRASVLSAVDRARMNQYLGQIEAETSIDIRLLFDTPPDGQRLDVFAAAAATRLGIGRANGLRGLLVLYDPGSRRMRVEVGYGLEEFFPDAFVAELIEDQVRWHFQSNDPARMHLMLRILHWRIRDHMLGGHFDPVEHPDREGQRYVSGGGGATATVPRPGEGASEVGSMGGFRTPLDAETRSRFGAQPTPEAAFARYMDWLGLGRLDADLGLFTPGSRQFIQGSPLTPPYLAFIRYNMAGQDHRIAVRGDRALLYFTTTPLVSPLFLYRDDDGWRMDAESEVQCSAEFAGGGITWTLLDGCRALGAFDDLLLHLPGGVIRVRGGDNRPLPTPEIRARTSDEAAVRWPEEVTVAPALPEADAFGYPPAWVDKVALLRLLRARRWADLEDRLASFNQATLEDVRFEYQVVAAYQTFARVAVGRLLDEWVAARPQRPEPLMARATHRLERAWDARGTARARDTDRDALRAMKTEVARGLQDLAAALAIDPRLPYAYDVRLALDQLVGDHADGQSAFEAGLAILPTSVRLRERWLYMLSPRWGGSYRAMAAVVKDAAPFLGRNPKLSTLTGHLYRERADASRDSADAISGYSRALSFGDEQDALRRRARWYVHADRYDLALADLNRAWMLRPEHPDLLKRRAGALYALARRAVADQQADLYDRAEADARLAQSIDPDRDTAELLEWIRQCRDWPEGCSRPGA